MATTFGSSVRMASSAGARLKFVNWTTRPEAASPNGSTPFVSHRRMTIVRSEGMQSEMASQQECQPDFAHLGRRAAGPAQSIKLRHRSARILKALSFS